ncbi:hypothetical protein Stsp02_68230 [Streptomyces sp. NBRC 14336]|uniref:hypothetical protein n=1 Tax=Streptomyces sp. NBRC 14336 TaxID=3030992 RepID=UPI0024A2B354|nr:hypothetical protein [Streptomyces sp. NBRC 14336]GLW51162.1 hypothetical protein Stsp02_68230 [Streptomyces sp. NBRC 14336]
MRRAGDVRRRVGVAGFLAGVVAALAFFAFCPGPPRVIDLGAVVVALAAGALARWGCQARLDRRRRR